MGILKKKDNEQLSADEAEDEYCGLGGYMNTYVKSLAITRTIYKTTVHMPGACSETHGGYIQWNRNSSLNLQHFRNAFVSQSVDEAAVPSTFSKVWGAQLAR